MTDWYEKPKPTAKPLPSWLRHLLISITTGVLSGLTMAIILVLKSYILPDSKIDYELSKEVWVATLALMVGASMGLVIGTPIALIFAPIAIKLTENVQIKWRFAARLILGSLGGYLGFAITRALSKSTHLFDFDFNSVFIPSVSGMIGAAIYLWIYKPQAGKD